MQCDSCKRCEVVDQSEVEADVYALSASILRYCIYCGAPTVWRRAPEGLTVSAAKLREAAEIVAAHSAPARTQTLARKSAELKQAVRGERPRLAGVELLENETLPAPALPPAASAVVAKAANRRRDVRTRVNLSACVRLGELEEVVECANLSKRGFGFRSRKQYPIGCEIDVAVPFYVGTPPAFVRGSVRHVTALPGNNFQYGVMYVHAAAGHPHQTDHGQQGH
jgi:hypothetical protein